MTGPKRLDFNVEREADGRWLAESVSMPGAMAYGATEAGAVKEAAARQRQRQRQLMWERADLDESEAWHLASDDNDPVEVAPVLATVVRAGDVWAWELRHTLGLGFVAGHAETRPAAMRAAGEAVRVRLTAVSLLVLGAIMPAPESGS